MARPRSISDERILEVAKRCFLRHGPSVSTQVVADELGISQPALFRRFGTKEDLLIAALMPKRPPFHDILDAGPSADPFQPQLRVLLKAISEFFWEMIPCMSMLRAVGIDSFDQMHQLREPPPIKVHKSLIRWLTQCRELGHFKTEDINTLATMMLGSLQFRPFLHHLDKDYPTEVTLEQYVMGLEGNILKLLDLPQAPSAEIQ